MELLMLKNQLLCGKKNARRVRFFAAKPQLIFSRAIAIFANFAELTGAGIRSHGSFANMRTSKNTPPSAGRIIWCKITSCIF